MIVLHPVYVVYITPLWWNVGTAQQIAFSPSSLLHTNTRNFKAYNVRVHPSWVQCSIFFLSLFVHFSFSYLDCFQLLFCCSILVIFLFPNPLCFSAWKSRVWCSCRLNTQLTVSVICHSHTTAGESLPRQAETHEKKPWYSECSGTTSITMC